MAPSASFGVVVALPGEDLAVGVLGVDGVALAVPAAFPGTGWPAALDDLAAMAAEELGQPAPVGAGALDAEGVDGPEVVGPGQ